MSPRMGRCVASAIPPDMEEPRKTIVAVALLTTHGFKDTLAHRRSRPTFKGYCTAK